MLQKIRCKYLLEIIFHNMKKRKRMKILKYNKNILSKINIAKEDFKTYELLKEFNQKFNLEIEDTDVEALNLCDKNIDNIGLEYLIKIGFKKLKLLNLGINEDSENRKIIKKNYIDINILQKFKFENLEQLSLSDNLIDEIKIYLKK